MKFTNQELKSFHKLADSIKVKDSVKISDDLQSEIIKHLQNAMVYAKNEYWRDLARELYELDRLIDNVDSHR